APTACSQALSHLGEPTGWQLSKGRPSRQRLRSQKVQLPLRVQQRMRAAPESKSPRASALATCDLFDPAKSECRTTRSTTSLTISKAHTKRYTHI
ncbi:hypothetical protein M514_27106, partial [Trichuris suis]